MSRAAVKVVVADPDTGESIAMDAALVRDLADDDFLDLFD